MRRTLFGFLSNQTGNALAFYIGAAFVVGFLFGLML